MPRPLLVALVILAACPAGAAPERPLAHWDFETGDLQGWFVAWGNLGPQPTHAADDRWGGDFGKQGEWFIGTTEAPGVPYDDARTGAIWSPPFVIRSNCLRLLVGGGGDRETTYVALHRLRDHAELMRAAGRNAEVMLPVLWDVSAHRGEIAYIRIEDRATGGWGHINVDDIRELTPQEENEVARQQAQAKKARAERIRRFKASLAAPARRKVYSGKALGDLAMPLGGIGTGSIAIGGRGDLREWQIFNTCNTACVVPAGFFGVRVDQGKGTPVARLLQMDSVLYLPPVESIKFVGEYPIAELRYADKGLPVEVRLEAFSPFAPMNPKDSALPAIVFEFTVRNPLRRKVEVSLLASCQNAVGYDGRGAITGTHFDLLQFPGYGGNVNRIVSGPGSLGVEMTAPEMSPQAKHFGSMALLTTAPGATARAAWNDPNALWQHFTAEGGFETEGRSEPTGEGRTANCAVAAPVTLQPGEEKTATFVLAWHFPNHYADYDQRLAKHRIGNMYANWFDDAPGAAGYVVENLERLTGETRRFRDAFYDSTLPYWLLDCVSSQISTLRSQTVMWIEDGTLAAFEGCCCCPMNCTHVWNYEQTLAHLFPSLERNMRETDLVVQQDPSGFIHHRTVLPITLPRASGAFADGHLGCIMKAYREHLRSADDAWLRKYWPNVRTAMDWAMATYDPDGKGVIEGEQWNTYDIAVYGPNTFIGSWYLGALRAAEEMAKVCGDAEAARRYRERFEKGSAAMDKALWNGEYYIQKYDAKTFTRHQYGTGCLADQVVGQWFAHVIGLGYLLPEERVKGALGAIVKHNFMWDFSEFVHSQRVFAWGQDMGLLCCTWPRGGRPKEPILYCDEAWTGLEYQVASHLLYEGMAKEALQIVRAARNRYDGVPRAPFKRNPWNEIECGDHYTRAMSSWALLLAAEGYEYDGPEGALCFDPRITPEKFRAFFTTAEGYGTFGQRRTASAQTNTLEMKAGQVVLKRLTLRVPKGWKAAGRAEVGVGNAARLDVEQSREGDWLTLRFRKPLALRAGETLRVRVTR